MCSRPCTAAAGTRSRRVPPSRICTSRSARTATRSIPASRSSSIRVVASSASSGASKRPSAQRAPRVVTQNVGGQAVLEGVMMRGPRNWAVAVRKPDGEIAQVARSIDPLMARHWALRLPVVRGVVALGESLSIGFRALSVSANYAAQEAAEGDEEPAEIGRWALAFAFLVAIGFALMMFKVGPALLTDDRKSTRLNSSHLV